MGTDLASLLLRKGVGSMTSDRTRCAGCRRTPVPGELLHVFEGEHVLCALCLARLPESERTPIRSEQVPASRRQLEVVRAA